MIQYIYFVKCSDCEDEPFDFFDEAKQFALGCLSKKPIITQIEVDRNDFGECTDSCDLGTVWSWEDVMKETDAEPAISVFTKDDLKGYCPDCDPEFDNLDNSIDFELDDVSDNFKKSITESYATKEFEIQNFDAEIIDEFEDEGIKGYNIVYSKNGTDIVEVEVWETDSPVTVNRNLHTPNLMQGYYSSFDAFASDLKYKTSKYVRVRESIDKKPIPEDMTIEQLVEEMEENEDTVECTWCNDLFDKDQCRKEVNLGYLCSRCEAAIKSRGEKLTFEENNYWDFLDESLEELTLSDMVSDSIRHLVNDLGKDPEDENFANDVIIDIENNYETQIPEDPIKYIDWASAITCEVSRQLNNQGELNESAGENSSMKTFDPKERVEFEYKDIEVTVELGRDQGWDDWSGGWDEPIEKDFSGNFIYEVEALEVAAAIWEYFLDDEIIMSLPGGPEAMECENYTDEASLKFWGLHFEDLLKKYYDKLLEFFRDPAEDAAAEAFTAEYYDNLESDDYYEDD